MKKLLSVVLSAVLLCASTNSYCFAKTSWSSPCSGETTAKPITVSKQKDGEEVVVQVQGEESPTIIINNKSESKSSASANASSGSAVSKFILFAIKLGVGVCVAKFALNKLTNFGGYVSEGVSKGFNKLKDLATNVTANITSSINEQQKNLNEEEHLDEEETFYSPKDNNFLNKIVNVVQGVSGTVVHSAVNTVVSFFTSNFLLRNLYMKY